MRMTLEDVAHRLGQPVHPQYESFVRGRGIDTLHGSICAPAEICARNLEERSTDGSGPTGCGFVLCARGDGDFWVVPFEDAEGLARLWSHELRSLTDSAVRALDLLQEMAATPIPGIAPDQEIYALARVDPPSQAILDPITSDDLLLVARTVAGLEYFDRLEFRNPFTQAIGHLDVSGLALCAADGRNARLDLSSGALLTRNCEPTDLGQVAKVAQHLRCLVFPKLSA
jgi:hypothetical protein